MNEKKEVINEIKKVILARLELLPQNKKISIGSSGEFNKEELKIHIEKEDEVGKRIICIELEFLRALKEGKFNEAIASD